MSEIIDGKPFNWHSHPAVILQPKKRWGVALYIRDDYLIIRQERDEYSQEEDPEVWVPLEDVATLIDGLCDIMGVPTFGADAADTADSRPMTAAERQRRYRQRKRDAASRDDVTERDGELPLREAAE